MATKDNHMASKAIRYPQQDGTMLQGAIINYLDMLLSNEKAEAWEVLIPLYSKPTQHLTEFPPLTLTNMQRDMWLKKVPQATIERLTFHWNALAFIALADHNIVLPQIKQQRPPLAK